MVNRRKFLALLSSGIASQTATSALGAPLPPFGCFAAVLLLTDDVQASA